MGLPNDDERRQSPRESIELVVRYQRMNTFFADYAKNISRGGTFVATPEPLPPDTEFVFSIGVPELTEPLQLRAKVMWMSTADAGSKVQPPGMGIQFQYHDADERRRTQGLIERLMVKQLGVRHAERILGRSPKPLDE